MSYILEALKKSELQRDIGRVPGIDSEHETPLRQTSGKWIWVGIGVLLLNAGLLAVLLWPKAEQDMSHVTRLVVEPAPVQQPAPVAAAPDLRQIDVQPLRREAISAVPAQAVAPPVQQVTGIPPVVPKPVIEQQAPIARAGINDLPLWPQIPAHLFRQLTGGLRLDVHVYSDLSQDRFVLINLQKYHEGEQLQEGPLLDEITSEGVILSFQGQQFRVSAQ